jgi:MoxR-like ATPase
VGKSQIVAQVARDFGIDFLDVRAVQLDPVDLRGLPRIASDQTEWVPPKFLPTEGRMYQTNQVICPSSVPKGSEDAREHLGSN